MFRLNLQTPLAHQHGCHLAVWSNGRTSRTRESRRHDGKVNDSTYMVYTVHVCAHAKHLHTFSCAGCAPQTGRSYWQLTCGTKVVAYESASLRLTVREFSFSCTTTPITPADDYPSHQQQVLSAHRSANTHTHTRPGNITANVAVRLRKKKQLAPICAAAPARLFAVATGTTVATTTVRQRAYLVPFRVLGCHSATVTTACATRTYRWAVVADWTANSPWCR